MDDKETKLNLPTLWTRWPWLPWLLAGGVLGLALFVVYISNFFSYLSDKPETCMNCHIMGPQYATWFHSSHREAANCNDCHVPQDNVVHKYYFKAMDGLRHATIFTFRGEPQAIQIKEAGRHAVQSNCLRCHSQIFTGNRVTATHVLQADSDDQRLCWQCHRETPHGLVRSLSSAPMARVPTTDSMVPSWLRAALEEESSKEGATP